MSGRLAIRAAKPGDEGLVLGFVRALADYEKLSHEMIADEAAIAAALFAEHPRAYCDIASWDGKPAGFALWFYNYSSFRGAHGLYLEDLFVHPHLRGHGIGKAMLVRLAQRCRDERLGRFEWAVLDWNAPSIAFYKSLGAEALDAWTTFRISGEALNGLAASGP